MAGVPPTNPDKETSNKPTAKNDVAYADKITENVIDTFPHITPTQLLNIIRKGLVALTNSNTPTVQPPQPISRNDTADTETPKKVAITFDPTKVVMMNSTKINQSTKMAPKDEWIYELINDMYVRNGYVYLFANGEIVYGKDCKKYLVMRREFYESHWRIHAGPPYHTSKVAAWKNTEKNRRGIKNPHKNKTNTAFIGIYGLKNKKMLNTTHPMIATLSSNITEVDVPKDNHTTNITITIYVNNPNEQPITQSLARTLYCEGVLQLNKQVTLKHNMDLLLKYGFIDPNAEYEIKLVGNSLHDKIYIK